MTRNGSSWQDYVPTWVKVAVPLVVMAGSAYLGAFTSGWKMAEHLATDENAIAQLQKQVDANETQRNVVQEYLEKLSDQVEDLKIENARENARIFTILHDHWRDVPMMPDEREGNGIKGHMGFVEPAFAKQQPPRQDAGQSGDYHTGP